MTTLHTFGCSITQGFALPDTIRPITDPQGRPYTEQEILDLRIPVNWQDIHLYQPSKYAWPQLLADRLGIPINNSARRGACFQQISRQCAVTHSDIHSNDIVIVMWTYLSRISFQWPARTSVPFTNMVDPHLGWRSKILPGFNKFFGLSHSDPSLERMDRYIHAFIHDSAQYTYLDPMGVYNQYYNNLLLLTMTDGFLRSTGARIIHLSVEPEPYLVQLENSRQRLDPSLREPYRIPNPESWYTVSVDHSSSKIIHDPSIPPAPNDQHPSEQHHLNFADHIYQQYFS